MSKQWTREEVLELARGFQPACVLAAAADLNLFSRLCTRPLTAEEAANAATSDIRGTTVLLDALTALKLLDKQGARYSIPPSLVSMLTEHGTSSVLAMTQHQANCLRRWAQLAWVVKNGRPADRTPSVRGEEADAASFIGAMQTLSAPLADTLIREIQPLEFRHLLDIGGGSGTWTVAFLNACPAAKATLFDLPHVIPLTKELLTEAGLNDRVSLVAGDYLIGPLPHGADLAWVSAIVHQNSREQNQGLFNRIFRSLDPGGRIAIRDILMDPSRTLPVAGALFAVNMLVGTESGGTFTDEELKTDLEGAGFRDVAVARREEGMNSIVVAKKPFDS
ncbi:MAG: methyltransferase domain-containing protein [Acidobacteriia bacterium]|nr:methyltransferase domain-containing protein [Terriglobia bacterium]